MKKSFLLITLTFFFSYLINAQSISLSGATTIWTNDPCVMSEAPLAVKNETTNTLNILCKKIIIDTTSGTDLSFCWGGDCYPEFVYLSGSYNTLDPGEVDNIDFKGYYESFCDSFPATVKYCFYPETDPADSTCIIISYHKHLLSTTNVSELNLNEVSQFYPNPSNNLISFNYYFHTSNNKVEIVDILGNKVKELSLKTSGKESIYVGDLKKGIYFGNFLNEKLNLITVRKLIVK